MTADLASRYDLRVPRYTSYPTAPHFSDAVGPETYGDWLGGLADGSALSLYFHIPFCDTLCWFCGCHTTIVRNYKPVKAYIDLLVQEIDRVAERIPASVSATHLHWGGGSPTILTGEDWRWISDRIRSRFPVAETAEIAVEMDPRDTTEDYVRDLAAAGVNRVSIGVQDFDPVVQKAVNRIQPFDQTKRVAGWLAKHGIHTLNMDLMYGLPHQTVERVISMVDQAVTLNPQRVALFGYAHVPWMKAHQKLIHETDLPGTTERWDQYEAASARLVEAGYVAIGLDHFARPDDTLAQAQQAGKLHRNFQGYTVDQAPVLLGFGASSIGFLPQGYVQNVADVAAYEEMIRAGGLATARGIALNDEDRLRADIIERLMCDLSVDLETVAERHGKHAADFASEIETLKPLRDDGLLHLEDNVIAMSEEGRPLVRLAAAAFDTYLQSGKARHSRAV